MEIWKFWVIRLALGYLKMADPTIQTFCCHNANDTDRAVKIMSEFNTDSYNAVCLASSVLGIFGALYQVS